MKKKLRRSSTNRFLAGVCGGFAEYFGIQAKYVRIGYLVFSLICSIIPRLAILPVGIYLILYLAIPQETAGGNWSSFFQNVNSNRAQNTRTRSQTKPKDRKILHDAHERKSN